MSYSFKTTHITAQQEWDYEGKQKIFFRAEANEGLRTFLDNMKPDRTYEVEVKEWHDRRSRDANAYFWQITSKIAEAIGSTKEDVYREIIRDVGVFEIVPVREDAVEQWIRNWTSGGLGRVSEVMGDSKLNGYVKTINYFGSSCYDTSQMGNLINRAVEEAKSLGIETMTPKEIERLKGLWGKEL
jgi:hypothetical protein